MDRDKLAEDPEYRRKLWEEMVRAYGESVYTVCYQMLEDESEATDMAHEALIAAEGSLESLRDIGAAGAWLRAIARNHCLKLFRKRGRQREVVRQYVAALYREAHSQDADETTEWRLQRLPTALEKLPERERTIISLHYYKGFPFTEISEIFGISKERVSQLHTRSKKRLRIILEQQE